MALPNDFFNKVFQRFSYNVDLIEKRFANKRPSGLELDCDTGKIIQVVDAKRPRLTAEEAKEKLKTTLLAPPSLLGNSSLCSPFVNDMTAPRETKRRVLKHNKRFEQQLKNGLDCSAFLHDENRNDPAAAYIENDGDREEEEFFDLDNILDDENGDDEEEEYEDDDDLEDEEEGLPEFEDIYDGPSDEQDQDLEDELDKQIENEEELSFDEPEEEAEKVDDTYKNMKITRALIHRLTPKAVRGKGTATKALSKSSKKTASLNESTLKAPPRARTAASALKEQKEFTESTPKAPRARTTIGADSIPKKITRTLSAKEVPKTPTVSKKIAKAAPEKAISKEVAVTPHVEDNVKKARGRPRKSIASTETASTRKSNTKTDPEKAILKNTPVIESTVIKSRGRPRKSIVLTETSSSNVTPLASVGKKNTQTAKKKIVPLDDGNTSKEDTTLKKAPQKKSRVLSRESAPAASNVTTPCAKTLNEKKVTEAASGKFTFDTSEAPQKKARGRPRTSYVTTPRASTSTGKKITKAVPEKANSTEDVTLMYKKIVPRLSTLGRTIVPSKKYDSKLFSV